MPCLLGRYRDRARLVGRHDPRWPYQSHWLYYTSSWLPQVHRHSNNDNAKPISIADRWDYEYIHAPMLKSVSFPKVQKVVEAIFIVNAPKLEEIDLSSIQNCGDWLRIADTPSPTLLKIPSGTTGSPGGIGITNTSLTSIDSFTSSPGGVYFISNPLSRLSLRITDTIMTRSNN